MRVNLLMISLKQVTFAVEHDSNTRHCKDVAVCEKTLLELGKVSTTIIK